MNRRIIGKAKNLFARAERHRVEAERRGDYLTLNLALRSLTPESGC